MARRESSPIRTRGPKARIAPTEPAIDTVGLSLELSTAIPTPAKKESGDDHKFAPWRNDIFPVTLITGETPKLEVFDASKDPTPRPSIGHAVRVANHFSTPPSTPDEHKFTFSWDRESEGIPLTEEQKRVKARAHSTGRAEFRTHKSEIKAVLGEIRQLLGVKRNSDISRVLRTTSEAELERLRTRINKMIVNQNIPEVKKKTSMTSIVEGYGEWADRFINGLKNGLLVRYEGDLNLPEDVRDVNDVLNLLRLGWNQDKKEMPRNAALRKLLLMRVKANMDAGKRESREESKKYVAFMEFLARHVWEEGGVINNNIYLLSQHSIKDYGVEEFRRVMLTPEERRLEEERIERYNTNNKKHRHRLTPLPSRTTSYDGRTIPVHIGPREEKNEASTAIKMLRIGELDPVVANKDMRGAEIVVPNIGALNRFMDRIHESAAKAQILLSIEDITDTIKPSSNVKREHGASNPKTPGFKFRVHYKGTRFELTAHIDKSILRYKNEDGIAHSEYQVRRLTREGVFSLLFAKNIYNIDHDDAEEELITIQRRLKREGIDLSTDY